MTIFTLIRLLMRAPVCGLGCFTLRKGALRASFQFLEVGKSGHYPTSAFLLATWDIERFSSVVLREKCWDNVVHNGSMDVHSQLDERYKRGGKNTNVPHSRSLQRLQPWSSSSALWSSLSRLLFRPLTISESRVRTGSTLRPTRLYVAILPSRSASTNLLHSVAYSSLSVTTSRRTSLMANVVKTFTSLFV